MYVPASVCVSPCVLLTGTETGKQRYTKITKEEAREKSNAKKYENEERRRIVWVYIRFHGRKGLSAATGSRYSAPLFHEILFGRVTHVHIHVHALSFSL